MKTKLALSIFILTLFVTLSSCASKEPAPPRERDESFIADINPFSLETIHLYTQRKIGNPKPGDLALSFDPRTNYIYVSTKIGLDFVKIGLSYQERKSLYQAYNKYIEALNANAIPNEKPNKKNAYTTGYSVMYWGVAGYSYEANAPYMTNAYYMEPNKPYFRLTYSAGSDKNDSQIYSPSFNIYISPAQWEHIIELCNQEHLVELTDAILAEVDEF